jgi:hypothetical protein
MYVVAVTKAGVQRWVVTTTKNKTTTKATTKTKAPTTTKSEATATSKAKSLPVARRVYVVCNGWEPYVVEFDRDAEPHRPGVARVWRQRDEYLDLTDDFPDDFDLRTAKDPIAMQHRLYVPWRSFRYQGAWIGYDPAELTKTHRKWWHGGNTVTRAPRMAATAVEVRRRGAGGASASTSPATAQERAGGRAATRPACSLRTLARADPVADYAAAARIAERSVADACRAAPPRAKHACLYCEH